MNKFKIVFQHRIFLDLRCIDIEMNLRAYIENPDNRYEDLLNDIIEDEYNFEIKEAVLDKFLSLKIKE